MAKLTVSTEEIDRAVEGYTVPNRFVETMRERGDAVALRWKAGETWRTLTWTEYAEQAARVAGGLRRLGVGHGDRVALMLRNRPEFHIADLAALFCGATPISIYNSSAPEQVQYLVSHCKASVAIVDDVGFLERFLKVREELPALQQLLVVDDPDGLAPDDVGRWTSLLEADPVDLDEAAAIAQPSDLATVIYTSGTTGPPKGVMLTHRNVCWTVESYRRLLDRDTGGLRTVSYLPMAHVAERVASHYLLLLAGMETTTCPDTSLLSTYLRETRPQSMFGVPRIWEKVAAGVQAALSADPEKAQKFDEAVAAAEPIDDARRAGRPLTDEEQQTWDFLDAVAFRPVRELIGMDALEFAVTGAAPIPPELIRWYRAIGVPLSEIYGMSENTGPLTWDPFEVKIGCVGRAIPGCEVKLMDDGEVVARGGHIFPGYLDDPEKTAEALIDGWLHTGDIGVIDDEGYLKIVDRKKELIITAGGKNISPANIEAALKSGALVGQACVIGDKRPFVSALLVLDSEVAPAWAKSRGIDATTLDELARHPEVVEEVGRSVDEANKRFSQVEQVKRWTIVSEEWLPDSEELTPTMKLKRRGIHAKYEMEIESLYS